MTPKDIRSLAMSMSKEAAELGRRFMFISLFCNGIATSLTALFLISFAGDSSAVGGSWMTRSLMALVAGLLFWSGSQFQSRAQNVPFPVALSNVLFVADKKEDESG